MGFFYAQELGIIFIYLPLVRQVHDVLHLSREVGVYRINHLIYHLPLHNRQVGQQVSEIVLINVIIHLVIHSLHDVLTDLVFAAFLHLEHPSFDVFVEVPCQDACDFFIMIENHNLNHILLCCFYEFDDFCIRIESRIYGGHVLAIYLLESLFKNSFLLHFLFIIVDQPTKLQGVAAKCYHKVGEILLGLNM